MREIWLSEEHLEKLAREAGYNAKNLAKLRKVSCRQLQRHFRSRFGMSPQLWLDQLRIEAATDLLRSGDPVKKIAFDLGFKHVSHFCRKFKLYNRMTCSEFVQFQKIDTGTCRSGITNVAQV
jgi:AraC-like DNA-binding protein